jgi:hypothetical protein
MIEILRRVQIVTRFSRQDLEVPGTFKLRAHRPVLLEEKSTRLAEGKTEASRNLPCEMQAGILALAEGQKAF